jgi:hypothetical protein
MSDAPVNVLVLVGGAVGGAGVVAAQAVAARRLLGLRVGAARTIVAGAVCWTAFGRIGRRLHDPVEGLLFLPLLLGVPILATMGLLVAGEALLPSAAAPCGSCGGGGQVHAATRRSRRSPSAMAYVPLSAAAVPAPP